MWIKRQIMTESEKAKLVKLLKSKIGKGRGKQTQLEIAKAIDIDQGRISRLMNGRFTRPSRALQRLCDHLGIDMYSPCPLNVNESETLMSAMERNWDGTQEHARLLANFLDQVSAFTHTRTGMVNNHAK